jgi:hypothetical protein
MGPPYKGKKDRRRAKWDNIGEIFYSVEYYYGALFDDDHIKSPF